MLAPDVPPPPLCISVRPPTVAQPSRSVPARHRPHTKHGTLRGRPRAAARGSRLLASRATAPRLTFLSLSFDLPSTRRLPLHASYGASLGFPSTLVLTYRVQDAARASRIPCFLIHGRSVSPVSSARRSSRRCSLAISITPSLRNCFVPSPPNGKHRAVRSRVLDTAAFPTDRRLS